MTVDGDFKGILISWLSLSVRINHIGKHESVATFFDCISEISKSLRQIRPRRLRLKLQNFTNYVQQMSSSLFRRNEFLNFVAEKQGAHLVVVKNRRKRQNGGNLSYHIPLGHPGGAEQSRTTGINQQHNREFPLFLKDFDIWRMKTCRDIPVHIADIVTILIFTNFAECHTATLECRMVLSRKYLMRESLCPNLNFPNFFQKITFCHNILNLPSKIHYGTSTTFTI